MKRLVALVMLLAACGEPDPSTLDLDGDGATGDVDCDDADASIGPHLVEACDGIDRDCDGDIDASAKPFPGGRTWAPDRDADGWGDDVEVTWSCQALGWPWIATLGDCDDRDPKRHPDATEICNGTDDDCDGKVDDEDPDRDPTLGERWYVDVDRDGWGEQQRYVESCTSPGRAYSDRAGDCAPQDPARHPDAKELCNGVDDDCNGWVDGAGPEELPEDQGLLVYPDRDRDGFGDTQGAQRVCDPGEVTNATTVGGDCNDRASTRFPGATETCNGADDDCDGMVDDDVPDEHRTTLWPDGDGDAFGDDDAAPIRACPRAGFTDQPGDCDDTDELVRPGRSEICNGYDDDCDGYADEDEPDEAVLGSTYYLVDSDLDLWGAGRITCGAVPAEAVPPERLLGQGDCDDTRADIHPGVVDDACDGFVGDCTAREEFVIAPGTDLYPYQSIVQAHDSRLCLEPGEHRGLFLTGRDGIEVWGAGRDTTTILVDHDITALQFALRGKVKDLTIRGDPALAQTPPRGGAISGLDGLTIERVRIADLQVLDTYRRGLVTGYGDTTLRDVLVEDVAYEATQSSLARAMIDVGSSDASITLERLTVRDVAVEGGQVLLRGGVLRALGQQVDLDDVWIERATVTAQQSPVYGAVASLTSRDLTEIDDLVVRDVQVTADGEVHGAALNLRVAAGGTYVVRHVDVRDVTVDAASTFGAVVALEDGFGGTATVFDLANLVVAGIDVTTGVGGAHHGVVAFDEGGGRPDAYDLRHATFADVDVASDDDVATLICAADGAPPADALVLSGIAGSGPLAADANGTPLTDTLLGPGLWVGDTPTGGLGPLTSAPDAGFVAYDPATDPATWDLHLLPTSPAVDLLDGVLPDDADGSPADAGAYGGPDGAW